MNTLANWVVETKKLQLPSGTWRSPWLVAEIPLKNYNSRDAQRPAAAWSLGPRIFGGPGRPRISFMASANTRRVGDGAGGAFQPYLDSLRQELQQRDPTLLSVAVAVLAVLLTLGEAAGVRCEGGGVAPHRRPGRQTAGLPSPTTHLPDQSRIERGR